MDQKSSSPPVDGESPTELPAEPRWPHPARAVFGARAEVVVRHPGPVCGTHADVSIMVDGVEVRNSVRAWAVPLTKVGELNRVILDVLALDGVSFAGSAYVGVTGETADLLVKLGWLPPDHHC